MLRKIACFALAASALTGCIIVAKPAGTVQVYGHLEPHGHSYIYLPAYHAYIQRVIEAPPVAAAMARERIALDTYKG